MSDNLLEVKKSPVWDHSSDQNFVDYYAEQSTSPNTIQRFSIVRDKVLRLLSESRRYDSPVAYEVADIGCGTGTQARLWADLGHQVHAIDVNSALVDIGRRRASNDGVKIQFDVGSATELPYPNLSMDVVLLPELLEHVADWQGCLNEAIRILKPGGVLYLSTTNHLCPIQDDFNLPLYSWYPSTLKRHFERLAVTTRPKIANYCKYPAVNWFSFYSLAEYLGKRGLRCLDRFDMIDQENLGTPGKLLVRLARALPPLRFFGQVLTRGSIVFAIKK
jgi:2-polyprenyl-6-hydroxyphenyl methylase/3-demethylubiquinone-9 3-methyltransferase